MITRLTYRFCFILLLTSILVSCNNRRLSKQEYRQWFDADRGFIKEKQISNINVLVQYRPIQLHMMNEIESDKEYTTQDLAKIQKSYGSSKYFMMEVSLSEKLKEELEGNYSKYTELLEAMAFDMQRKVKLKVKNKIYSVGLYHYEPNYELGNKKRFLFAFECPEESKGLPMTLVYSDELINAHNIKFKFEVDESNLPELPVKIKKVLK